MTESPYNNAKDASNVHIPFELNCGYYPCMSYDKDIDPCFRSKSAERLSNELQKLMLVCHENLHYAQEL